MTKAKKPTLKDEFLLFWGSNSFPSELNDLFDKTWDFFEPHLKKKASTPKPKVEIPQEQLITYNEIFPKIKGGSGKSLRCNLIELEKSFQYFFRSYDYDWQTILEAAKVYVQDMDRESYKYCRTSKYFCIKFKTAGMPESLLADYCVKVLAGDHFEEDTKSGFDVRVY